MLAVGRLYGHPEMPPAFELRHAVPATASADPDHDRPGGSMSRVTSLVDVEVFGAIRALLEQGAYPTAAALREQLGGRGSPVVLQRFLADWYRDHGPLLAQKAAAHRPAATAGLRSQMQALAKEAMAEVDAAQAVRVAELDRRQAELNELEASVSAVKADLDARTRRLDDREMAQAELLQELQSQLVRAAEAAGVTVMASAERRLSALEAQLAQTRIDVQSFADLRVELASTREARDHAQALLAMRTQERDAATKARAQLEAALKHAQDAAAAARAADTEVRVALATAHQALAAEQARTLNLTAVLAERQDAVSALDSRRETDAVARLEAERALATLAGRHAAVLEERDRLASAQISRDTPRPAAKEPTPSVGLRKSLKP